MRCSPDTHVLVQLALIFRGSLYGYPPLTKDNRDAVYPSELFLTKHNTQKITNSIQLKM